MLRAVKVWSDTCCSTVVRVSHTRDTLQSWKLAEAYATTTYYAAIRPCTNG